MAGRHGVAGPERRSHARRTAGARRRRAQRRDVVAPWRSWLLWRVGLTVPVLAAVAVAVVLVARHRGGWWPVVALVAGGGSLVLIGFDVMARRRRRARLAADPAPVSSRVAARRASGRRS